MSRLSAAPPEAQTGLVLTVPELAPLVDRWRRPTMPMASVGVPVHVTALFPWLPGPTSPADLGRLREALHGIGPVTLTFRRTGTFPGGVVFLRPEPDDVLRRLTYLLHRAFPSCPPYGGEFGDPVPHLTVALTDPAGLPDLEREVRAELASKLPVSTTIRQLTVMEQQPDEWWYAAHQVPLETR